MSVRTFFPAAEGMAVAAGPTVTGNTAASEPAEANGPTTVPDIS